MALTSNYGLFGTKNRTNVLLLLALMKESHAAELSRLLGTSVSNVQKTLDSLEGVGVVAGVVKGRERRVSLDPRYFARAELRALLDRMALASPDLLAAAIHWNDMASIRQAVAAAWRYPVDLERIAVWCEREGGARAFETFRRLFSSRP